MSATPVRAPFRWAIAALAGALTLPLLAAIWHLCHFATPAERGDYHLTSFITNRFGVTFFFTLFVICIGVGWLTTFVRTFAFAAMLPFPIALAIELSEDPTSHNLFPFEIVFVWIPIFALIVAALFIGRYARRRAG